MESLTPQEAAAKLETTRLTFDQERRNIDHQQSNTQKAIIANLATNLKGKKVRINDSFGKVMDLTWNETENPSKPAITLHLEGGKQICFLSLWQIANVIILDDSPEEVTD